MGQAREKTQTGGVVMSYRYEDGSLQAFLEKKPGALAVNFGFNGALQTKKHRTLVFERAVRFLCDFSGCGGADSIKQSAD